MRDLTGEHDDVVAAERARVATEGWGARLLDLQGPDGQWGGGTYFPEGLATAPTLMLLRDMGLDPESDEARRAIALVRENSRWEHEGQPFFEGEVEPRTAYPRLLLKTRVPWAGRAEDKTDHAVWAVTCFVTRKGFRRRGISRALARAAVDFAQQRGARAIEGYPMITQPGQKITLIGELHVGSRSIFAAAGVRRSQQAHSQAGRDADRLLGAPRASASSGAHLSRRSGARGPCGRGAGHGRGPG